MPWKETTPVDQRMRFIAALSSCEYTMSELCRKYGISRKTGYKWADRYTEEGIAGLQDRSRRPTSCPHRTDGRCEKALVKARQTHPRWGPKKLLVGLYRRHPDWPWPSVSTAGSILKRHGLVAARRGRRRTPAPGKPRVEPKGPNEVWTTDFKGEFRLGNRQLCYPLTVVDGYSRYLLGCRARRSTGYEQARPVYEELFATYGLPRQILSDNGPPFAAARAVRRLSRLSVWWIKLGITPVLIQPAHPEQNGRHERMHRTLKAETARPPAADERLQQQGFDRFRQEYNRQRPHEGIGLRTPAELYETSPRPYPHDEPAVLYPGHFELRRVRTKGDIRWRGQRHFLSEALSGETVGLEEVDDGLWSLRFGPLLLGRYDERDKSLELL
jgi:putative transposase